MNQILTVNVPLNVLSIEGGVVNTLVTVDAGNLVGITEEVVQVISTPVQESLVTVQEVTQLITEARQGPPGPPGSTLGDASSIGGVACVFTNLAAGDVIAFTGNTWSNVRQTNLTDGGNF